MADEQGGAVGESPGDAVTKPASEQATNAPPQENGQAVDGFRRTDPSEVVTAEEAVAALNRALDLLKKANNPNMPWQDARHVLDVTGDALDVAGLALKAEGVENAPEAAEGDEDDEGRLGEVQWLSMMVSAARSRFLGDAYVDAKMKEPPPLPAAATEEAPLVLWASQTGTAESFAQSLVKSLRKIGSKKNKVDIMDMKDAALKDVVMRKRVYFVVSTFGIGRPPRMAETFYANMQLYRGGGVQGSGGEGVSQDAIGDGGDFRPLAGVEVAVAALGDSRFKDFAQFGVNLLQELQALGARPMVKVTTVDGKDGPEVQNEKFQSWEDLIKRLESARIESSADVASRQQSGADSSCCVVS